MRRLTWPGQGSRRLRGMRSLGTFRRRFTLPCNVKRTECAGRSQNRQLMRGGRA
jgi:hypothetical protein